MPFDPNEPRDAFGRWTDSMTSATRCAATDTKPKSKGWSAKAVEAQNDELIRMLRVPNEQVNLNGLYTDESDAVVEVLREVTKDGTEKVPVDGVNVCFGTHYDIQCAANSDAGAFYGFNFETGEGELYINPTTARNDFQYVEKIPTHDDHIAIVNDLLAKVNDPVFVEDHHLTESDVQRNRENFGELLLHFQLMKEHGVPSVRDNFSQAFKDDKDRMKSIVFHEMGHMKLKQYYMETFGKDVQGGEARSSDYKTWRGAALTDNASYPKGIWQDYANSEYGRSNGDEYFAEWFAAYQMGEDISKMPKPVTQMIANIHDMKPKKFK
jgi:hypothetical protein